MRIFLAIIALLLFAATASSQSIKMKMPTVTPAAGEEVLAFEFSDTIPIFNAGPSQPRVKFQFVKIKKTRGASTNELFKRSVNFTFTPELTFEFFDSNNILYYKIVLKAVTIHHFSFLSPECTGCNELMHQIWFDFDVIEATDVATGNMVRYDRGAK